MPGNTTPQQTSQQQQSFNNQQQSQQQQGHGVTGPNPVIQGMLGGIANSIYGNYTGMPGGIAIAPPSMAQESARNAGWGWATRGLNDMGGQYAPSLGYLSNAANGQYLDLNKNPYFQGAVQASLNPVTENFMKSVVPGISSTFGSAGRPGAGLQQDALAQAVTNFGRTTNEAAAQMGNQAYGMERGLQQGAAQAIPGVLGQFGNQAQNWLNIMGGIGQGDTAYAQARLTGPMDLSTRVAMMLQGAYPGGLSDTSGSMTGNSSGSSSMYGTGTSTPSSNGFGSALGGGLGLLGLGLQAAGPMGFGLIGTPLAASDREDKTDITELGIDPLTGLKSYAYRYKGDPKTYPKVVGPMAQDVEKVAPHLVRQIGGHRVVHASVMPQGGLM